MFSMFSFLLSGNGGKKLVWLQRCVFFMFWRGQPKLENFQLKIYMCISSCPSLSHNLDHFQIYNEMWKRFKCEQFCLSLGISWMTLAGSNTGLCVFLGKAKFIYYRPLKTTPMHSPISLLQYPPKVPRPQILLLGVFSRVSCDPLREAPPFWGSVEGWLACRNSSQGVKKNQVNLARADLFSDKNHFVKQKGTYEKDTFYANFLFKHLSTLTKFTKRHL